MQNKNMLSMMQDLHRIQIMVLTITNTMNHEFSSLCLCVFFDLLYCVITHLIVSTGYATCT